MNWRRPAKLSIAALSVFFGAIVTAWVNAKMTGAPLNGLPGIFHFWSGIFRRSAPVWLVCVLLALVVAGCGFWITIHTKRARGKVDLRIVVLSTPTPRWNIGAMGQVPVMMVSFHAQLAHKAELSLQIVKGYLSGTECVTPFIPLVVTGPHDSSVMVHFGVRPIPARDGQSIVRRAVLVDQFGDKHRTGRIRFDPGPRLAVGFNTGSTAISCFFCRKPIAMEDLAESSAVPAHKSCIR